MIQVLKPCNYTKSYNNSKIYKNRLENLPNTFTDERHNSEIEQMITFWFTQFFLLKLNVFILFKIHL